VAGFGRRPVKEKTLEMGTFTIWHWLVVLVVVALVFGGRGRLSGIMGDAAKGIRAFREGLKGEEEVDKKDPPTAEEPPKPLPKPESSGTRARTKAKTSTGAKPRAKAKAKAKVDS
jgi:sec-independent protein translocase protein TatA